VKEPVWIREIEALAFHAQQIATFGGSDGVRDRGLLDSALARPKNLFAYADHPPSMAELAAAYGFGISSNHPFVDGNKRTAMQVAFVFVSRFSDSRRERSAKLNWSFGLRNEPRASKSGGRRPG
jgi:death-on-curing protein